MRKFLAGVILCGWSVASVALADEPKCQCPASAAVHEVGVPLLSKVPYLSRLFKNVGVAVPVCPQECADAVEHIGVDFEFTVDGQTGVLQICPVDGPATACQVGNCQVGTCQANGCKVAACQAQGCQLAVSKVATKGACKCAADCCPDGQCCCAAKATSQQAGTREAQLWEKIVELSAGQAAAEAAFEVQSDSLERSSELLEALAEVHAEKAKLEARLEALAETNKIAEQLLELAAENTRLKAQVELAEAKAEVMQATVEMTVENERLKMRVAELEEGGSGKAARTAARVRTEKKAR
jgi:hypothetical protein